MLYNPNYAYIRIYIHVHQYNLIPIKSTMSCNRQRWKQDNTQKNNDGNDGRFALQQRPAKPLPRVKKLSNSMRQKNVGYI